MAYLLNREQFIDMTNGAIILGSGGGGDIKTSFKLVDDIFEITSNVTLTELQEVPDDAYVAVISGMGSPVSTKERGFNSIACVHALERLEQATGKKIEYVTAFELGGGNFMPPVYTACYKNIHVIDSDGVGRAVPEESMTMTDIHGVPSCPFSMADERGVGAVLYANSSDDCEKLGRPIVSVFGGSAGVANYMMDGATAKKVLIGGSYRLAHSVGKAIRTGIANGGVPAECVAKAIGGIEIIVGTVTELVIETINSHDWGYQIIKGTGKYEGQQVKIFIENENIIAFDQDNKVRAISPDALCVMKTDGSPLTNADLEIGMEVAFIGVKCHERWLEGNAVAVYKPVLKHFGYEGPYIPVDELNK